MDRLYRFSPIADEETFQKTLEYITVQLEVLAQKVLGEKLPVSILKIFPHYLDEYAYLYELISQKGPQASFTSEKNLYVTVDEMIKGNHITALGVRIVDPYRMQVGCGDYEVDDYESYKETFKGSPFVRDMGEKNMLEIWHPDFDVLGYVIPKE